MIRKRAVTNIVATMIIFSLMIMSMAVLYSVITPTVLGFSAKTQSANQEFILLSIANEFEKLVAAPSGSQSRVKIIADGAVYNVTNGYQLSVSVLDGASALIDPGATLTDSIGEFHINQEGSFTYEINDQFISRTINEDTLLQNDSSQINSNIVSKVHYEYNAANFTLYSRARVDVIETTPNTFTVTITVARVDFTVINGAVTDFPISKDEFTLRLYRKDSTVTTVNAAGVNGPFTIAHSINGNPSTETYNFGTNAASTITLKFITVPVHFSI